MTAPQCALQVMRLQTGNRVNNRSSNRKCGAYFSRVLESPITCWVSIQHLKILNSCIRKCSWTVKIWLTLKELYCKNCEPVSGFFFVSKQWKLSWEDDLHWVNPERTKHVWAPPAIFLQTKTKRNWLWKIREENKNSVMNCIHEKIVIAIWQGNLWLNKMSC